MKKRTRVALSEPAYLQRISEIAYVASSIEWTILGDINRLKDRLPENFCLDKLESQTTGSIAKEVREAAKQCQDREVRTYLEAMGEAFSLMASIRNNVLHTRPATRHSEGVEQQRLSRAEVGLERKLTGKRFWIDDAWFDDQVDQINHALDNINAVRPRFND